VTSTILAGTAHIGVDQGRRVDRIQFHYFKNIMVGRDRIVARAGPRATHRVSPDIIVAGKLALKIGGGRR
jgi:hypothetical protein